jgi:hypothetical protein
LASFLGIVLEFTQKLFTHGIHEHRGGEAMSAMKTPEGGHPRVGLPAGPIDVEIHAVEAFDFQGDVILEDVRDGVG